MKTIPISLNERIVVSRSGLSSTAQYQVRTKDKGWTTSTRRSYEGNEKVNVVEDIKAAYNSEKLIQSKQKTKKRK